MDGLTTRDRVGILRVQRPAALPLGDPALRLRVERQIGMLALRPARLPEGAVLIVRRLAMRMDVGASHAPLAGRVLDDLLARAARPVLAPVPPTVPAVLFADAAELLACLTRDVLQGRLRQRWYWQQIDGQTWRDGASALGAIWQQHAPAAPAAILLLAVQERRGLVATLGDTGCNVLTRALAAAFAVDAAEPVPHRPDTGPLASGEYDPRAGARVGDNPPPLPAAPWQPWVEPATVAGLAPDQVFLLGFGLALAHAPAYARSAAFQHSAARWLVAATALHRPSSVAPSGAGDGAPSTPATAESSPAGAIDPALHRTDASLRAVVGQGVEAPAAAPRRQSLPGEPAAEASAAAYRVLSTEPDPLASETGDGVMTGLAGVLYLINLMRWLDLPAAAHAGGLDARLGAWAMLDALARLLLSADSDRGRADPLWACLAGLDGRPAGSVARAGLSRPVPFRLPAAWVQRWLPVERPWTVSVGRGRLRLADTVRGVLIADVPLAGRSPALAVAAEIDAYRAAGVEARAVAGAAGRLPYLPATVRAAVAPGLGWWLRRADGFVRHVLARQLRCAPHDLPAHLAGLYGRRGRVTISRTHVDLYLSMEQVDMAARRSGLDQDPGWAPDFGRIITFHFA